MDTRESEFSVFRIKKIMKCSPGVDKVNNEACFVMAKAAEGFVAHLLRQSLKASENKAKVDYPDIANVVSNSTNLEFLKDIVPHKIKGKEYLEILKRVEEEERRIAKDDL